MSLKVSREGRVLRLTLNRAEKRNALDRSMCERIVQAAADQDCGAILLDSEGPVFCAGMDLDSADANATRIHGALFSLGTVAQIPIVAAVQGPALGGGLGLVANAHVVIASHGVQFGLPEIRLGMWPFVIWPSIVRMLSERRATMLALTGRLFGAQEALQWGVVHELVPDVELDDRAGAVANALANSSATAIASGLRFAAEAHGVPHETAIQRALQVRATVFDSPDFVEGVAAFREQRRPDWPSLKSRATKE